MRYSVRWVLVLCPNNNFIKRILLYSFHSNTWTVMGTKQAFSNYLLSTLSLELGILIPKRLHLKRRGTHLAFSWGSSELHV